MAIIVARQGESAPVRIPAPRPIRPFLRFAKLPPRALGAARIAIEDDEFRARVADRVDEEEVGRAGWLLLTRPDGWDEEFDELVRARADQVATGAEDAARRDLTRANETIRAQQREIDAKDRELRRLQQQHVERDDLEAARLADLDEAIAASDSAAAERARAVRELKDMERRLGARTDQVRELEARLADGMSAVEPSSEDGGTGGDPDHDDVAAAERAAIARLVGELRVAWEQVGGALTRLDAALGDPADDGDDTTFARGRGRGRTHPGHHRRPLRLGQGLVDGTPAAARWLLARPGVVALVDGYNVTMLAWPDLSVADQRIALERAATQVQLQLGAQVVLVFDGDSEGGAAVRSAVGSPVRVRFTHRDTEADDEILEMVAATTAPVVVVVSNDRRVLDGARQRGANTIRSTDFVALLR